MTTTSEVPGKYSVGLNGVGYLLDQESNDFRHVSIPQLKPQQDVGDETHEGSVNPDNFWRKSQQSWHRGMGQDWLDRGDADPFRYDFSYGVDPWTKYQLTTLPGVDKKRTSANTNLFLAAVGNYLYLTDGTSLVRTQDAIADAPTWTSVTGGPATAATSIATDGYNVWTSHTANGVYLTTRGAGTTASSITGNVTLVRYTHGRLMCAYQNLLYNVTAAGALPTALFTHANTDFTWVDIAEGSAFIYAAGYAGDKSTIYKTAVKADGTALDIPSVAGQLPDGEIVRAVYGYLGFLLVGTDTGVRFCSEADDGNLTIGSLIPTSPYDPINGPGVSTYAVKCFEGQGRFVWFGWPSIVANSVVSGLGRLDLTEFIAPLTPAYATDLLADGTGDVLSAVTFTNTANQNRHRIFTVSGRGVYGPVDGSASATMYTTTAAVYGSRISYGLSDTKTAHQLLVDLGAGIGVASLDTITVYLINALSSATSLGTINSNGGVRVAKDAQDIQSTSFAPLLSWTTPGDTTSPVINGWTLLSDVVVSATQYIYVPLLISENDDVGYPQGRDLASELSTLKTARSDRSVIEYQEGTTTYSVILEDFEWRPHHKGLASSGAWNGTFLCKLKVVPSV
jgi:hypothetical protein